MSLEDTRVSIEALRLAMLKGSNLAERRARAEKIADTIEAARGPRLRVWDRFVRDTSMLFDGRLTFQRWARTWRRVLEAGHTSLGRPRVLSDAERARRKVEAQRKWAGRTDVKARRARQARERRTKLKQAAQAADWRNT